ncbi:MAG TPA: hypothetical protein PK074_11465 [Spirochaetales bacterium]|nr:hypothetical protein [Spirochaetales bacterium]
MPEDNNEKSEQKEQSYGSFEEFVNTLDEQKKELYSNHISGLKNALESEKENRRKLAEQVKALSPAVEKGSELERKLAETAKLLEEAEQRSTEYNRRATFAEQAIRPGVNCSNIKAAYALAVSEGLFDEDNSPKWKELQKLAPELFRATKQTNAGNTEKSDSSDINAAIRRAAGI